MTSLLGPGMIKSVKLTGVSQMTLGQLRLFVAGLEEPRVPDDAPVELAQEDPDRPGSARSWSIAVRWRDEEPER